MQVVDVSTPISPVPVARLHVLNAAYSMVEKDGYLIVAEIGSGAYGAIKTIDISDPTNAWVAAEYYTVPGDRPMLLSLSGDTLAAACTSKNWLLLDVSDPLNISSCYSLLESDYCNAFDVWGDALYIAFSTAGHPLKIYDISDPYSPVYKKTVDLDDTAYYLSFSDENMYASAGVNIEVYSIVSPFNPNHVNSYNHTSYWYMEHKIQGEYLYAACKDELEIVDISVPDSPVYKASELIPYDGTSGYGKITVEGQFAYLAGYDTKSHSCWIFPPDDPQALGPIYEGFSHSPREIFAHDGYLYEGSESMGIFIYKLY